MAKEGRQTQWAGSVGIRRFNPLSLSGRPCQQTSACECILKEHWENWCYLGWRGRDTPWSLYTTNMHFIGFGCSSQQWRTAPVVDSFISEWQNRRQNLPVSLPASAEKIYHFLYPAAIWWAKLMSQVCGKVKWLVMLENKNLEQWSKTLCGKSLFISFSFSLTAADWAVSHSTAHRRGPEVNLWKWNWSVI